ncbi:MAG: class I SAM-dependent methyltransferase [Candidatus Binatia bacterium]
MITQAVPQLEAQAHLTLSLLQALLKDYHPRDFAVRLWDNTTWEAEAGQLTRCTMILRHPAAVNALFGAGGELSVGESYLANEWDVEGAGEALVPLAEYLFHHLQAQQGHPATVELSGTGRPDGHPAVKDKAAHLHGAQHSRERDRQAISYHYDVSNDFYALWLDRRMVYTCAYFGTPEDDLDTAQVRKLDYVCRKLRLRPGQRLLDIGCGWGGLVMHAAQQYGVEAFGVTLSQEQAAWANERIQTAGLSQRCRVRGCDYRDVDETESYDALTGIGIVEHIGEAQLSNFFERACRLLRPRGVFLNHGIGCSPAHSQQTGPSFVAQYLFPDAEIVPLSTLLRAAELAGFEVRDVENLREHYALTARHWLRAIEAHHDEICRLTDEVTYRVWRISAIGSIYRFLTGEQNLYQVLLVKPERGRAGLPLTREDWYSRSATQTTHGS